MSMRIRKRRLFARLFLVAGYNGQYHAATYRAGRFHVGKQFDGLPQRWNPRRKK